MKCCLLSLLMFVPASLVLALTEVNLSTNPELLEFRGGASSDHLGCDAASSTTTLVAGDLNNDGIKDIIIASKDEATYGSIQIVFGQSSNSQHVYRISNVVDVKIAGRVGENFAEAIAIGDVNDDQIDDLIVGSSDADYNSLSNTGAVYVYFGKASWSSTLDATDADVTIEGDGNGDAFGYAVTSGDVNGDGIDDVIASARNRDTNALTNNGTVCLFFGRATWPGTAMTIADADSELSGPRDSSDLGDSVWTGDFNDDGTDDLFIGAYHDDDPSHSGTPGYSGVLYGILGHSTWAASITLSDSTADLYVTGTGTDVYGLGYRGACGDVNGDGVDDVVVLATDSASPRAVFFYGDATFSGLVSTDVVTDADYMIDYGNPNNNHGLPSSIACGDLDGDGIDDIAVGFSTSSPNGLLFCGSTTIYYGRSVWETNDPADVKYTGIADLDYLGQNVGIGDINGDGLADLMMNAPGNDDSFSRAGAVYIIAGEASEVSTAFALSGGGFTFGVSSRSGRTLTLQSSTDLSTWTDILTYNCDGSDHELSDTLPANDTFYRVKVNPLPAATP